jgi:Sulfotransferase domain
MPSDGIIVVSGLPRSGTSMMMRMLESGGLAVVTDHRRAPDASNPRGYYEDERVKRLRDGDHQWLESAAGKVVKVVSPLLEYLPARHAYKLIFMLRSVSEIIASQRHMLARQGDTPPDDDEVIAARYRRHLSTIESWLVEQSHIDTMYVRYREVTDNPRAHVIRISRFLERQLDCDAMVGSVDRGLYRERDGSR